MESIAEQARQNPKNSTPIGWDPKAIKYPGVNTCLTITAVCEECLVGLHLGLYMYNGEEHNQKSIYHFGEETLITEDRIEFYLDEMLKHIKVRNNNKNTTRVIVAGAFDLWKYSLQKLYKKIKQTLSVWSTTNLNGHPKIEYFQFDDKQCATVDIVVTDSGLLFYEAHKENLVKRLDKLP